MSYTAGYPAALRPRVHAGTATNLVLRLAAQVQKWNKYRQDAEHLRTQPDYLLRDIGISSTDINSVFLSKPPKSPIDGA